MTTGLIVAVANLKPGTSKSTSSMFICAALHLMGIAPMLIDADKGRSAQRWTEDAQGAVPWPVVSMPVTNMHSNAAAMVRDPRYGAVIIDCPQMEDHKAITKSALRLATDVLVPCAPAMIELDRTLAVAEELNDVDTIRDQPLRRWALITRANRRRRSKNGMDAVTTAGLTQQGYTVLDQQIETCSSRYRDPWGEFPPVEDTPYMGVARRLAESAGIVFQEAV